MESELVASAQTWRTTQLVADRTRFGHTGHNDYSQYTKNRAGALLDLSVPLPGNTTYIWTPTTSWAFSHANLHGDAISQTNLAGTFTWHGLSGPYGETASNSTAPNTALTGTTKTWHGSDGKLTDGNIVHMGARPYSPTHGRFLTADPIEGGCANDYTYVFGDPVNSDDLTGTYCVFGKNPNGSCRGKRAVDYVKRCGPALARLAGNTAGAGVGYAGLIVSAIAAPTGISLLQFGFFGATTYLTVEGSLDAASYLDNPDNHCL